MDNKKIINVYLLRHGQSKMNELHIIQGQKIFPENSNRLTDKGIKQIGRARFIIEQLNINKIFSSDLERCKETCKIINLKIPVFFVKELREQNCGIWEGKSSKEMFNDKIREKMDKEIEVIPPNGESMKQVSARAIKFLDIILKNENIKNILLVTHGAVIQGVLGHYLKIPHRYRFRIKIVAGSISHIVFKESSPAEIVGLGLR